MAGQSGAIGVTTENIFPIIKQFLYSDQEIFLRELVSNAVDATQKLRTLAAQGEFSGELADVSIEVRLDKEAGTLTVSDRGLGMTAEEVEKYINQIAFSGAEEFVEKYKDQSKGIIGHFGLGFYSAFMVSDQVDIITRSYREGAAAVRWSCQGDPSYTLEPASRDQRGTDIVLHIGKDYEEYLQEARIRELLQKYCRFLPVPIVCGTEKKWEGGEQKDTGEPFIVNAIEPIWTQRPADLQEEHYAEFYRGLYPGNDEPLFHIHLNVDYPFNLTGVLYFPRLKNNFDIKRNQIQLYCNQVFVTDSVEGIVPEYLTVLHGVIDSPDIPLNVSRSYLQSDGNVKKISGHITKKVADRLQEIFKNDREGFEAKWDDLKLFVDYGMVSEEKFYERATKFALLKDVDGKLHTHEEYQALVEEQQRDKHGKTVYLYTTDRSAQYSYIEAAKAKGYSVLVMDGMLDPHLIQQLEQKLENVHFARVDSETIDKLIEKDEATEVSISPRDQELVRGMMQGTLGENQINVHVSFEEIGEGALPVIITQNEFMRRMKDMAAMSPTNSFYATMPENYTLVLNSAHPLIKDLARSVGEGLATELAERDAALAPLEAERAALEEGLKDKKREEWTQEEKDREQALQGRIDEARDARLELLKGFGTDHPLAHQLVDLALLSNNMLKGEALAKFVRRSVELIGK
ncbi:MAG: molecular chaperone HtpG [Bacteroidia bacterium]|nr:MAG: molecular chaperone HtpG [Bacteroidia bacterium]